MAMVSEAEKVGEGSLRILYLMTDPFSVGGVQSDLLALSEDLCRQGHTVTVISRTGRMVRDLRERGAEHLDLDLWFRGPLELARKVRDVARFLRDHPVDILAPQSVRATIISSLARRLVAANGELPVVTTVHNIHSAIHYHTAGWIFNLASDFVVFESHYERNRLIRKGLRPAKTDVIYSGVGLERFRPIPRDRELLVRHGISERTPVVGTVARFSKEKGHTYLLQAFSRVIKKVPDAVLMLVGDGPLMNPMESLAAELGISDRVIFTGFRREMPQYLSLLDVFALASTRESFPLAAREAMAAGKPVVATRVGGCSEVVRDGETGFLVPAMNPERLADAILELLLDKEKARKMGARSRVRASGQFDHRIWIRKNEQVFQDILLKSRGD